MNPWIHSIYLEHVEEISHFWEQRVQWICDPEIDYSDLHELDARIDAHVDALCIGLEQDLLCVDDLGVSDEAGDLHALLRIYARSGRWSDIDIYLENTDLADEELYRAARDALAWELVLENDEALGERIEQSSGEKLQLWTEIAGYHRRSELASTVSNRLRDFEDSPQVAIEALGRLSATNAKMWLYRYLQSHEPDLAFLAARALLRLRERESLTIIQELCGQYPALTLALACAGGPSWLPSINTLPAAAQNPGWPLLALGIAGDPAAIDTLLRALTHSPPSDDEANIHPAQLAPEEVTPSHCAAWALYLITGAELFDPYALREYEALEIELVDPDNAAKSSSEASSSEASSPEDSAAEDRSNKSEETSQESGVLGISMDASRWCDWWASERSRFQIGRRYRFGQLFSSHCIEASLTTRTLPGWLREQLAFDIEIAVGKDFGFRLDLRTRPLLARVAEAQSLYHALGSAATPGAWYRYGQSAR